MDIEHATEFKETSESMRECVHQAIRYGSNKDFAFIYVWLKLFTTICVL